MNDTRVNSQSGIKLTFVGLLDFMSGVFERKSDNTDYVE